MTDVARIREAIERYETAPERDEEVVAGRLVVTSPKDDALTAFHELASPAAVMRILDALAALAELIAGEARADD